MTPPRRIADKRRSVAEGAADVAAWRRLGQRVVLAGGVFELLHVGHARYLASARAHGTRLVVAVEDDPPAPSKGAGPHVEIAHRATLIAALAVVDAVVVCPTSGWDELVRAIGPDVVARVGAPPPLPGAGAAAGKGARDVTAAEDSGAGSARRAEAAAGAPAEVWIAADPTLPSDPELVARVRERHAAP